MLLMLLDCIDTVNGQAGFQRIFFYRIWQGQKRDFFVKVLLINKKNEMEWEKLVDSLGS